MQLGPGQLSHSVKTHLFKVHCESTSYKPFVWSRNEIRTSGDSDFYNSTNNKGMSAKKQKCKFGLTNKFQ